MSKRFGVLSLLSVIVIMAVLSMPLVVSATAAAALINSATFYCDVVSFNYEVNPVGPPVTFLIYDGSNPGTATLLGQQLHGTATGTFDMTIPLSPAASAGTTLYIFLADGFSTYLASGVSSGVCVERPPDVEVNASPSPVRFFGGENARASILIVNEINGASNPVLTLYDVNESSQGSLLFYLSLSTATSMYPADAGQMVLIYENPAEFISFYRLSSGEFMVQLGPDAEGKMHILRFMWDGGEPYDVLYETYFVMDTPLIELVLAVIRAA